MIKNDIVYSCGYNNKVKVFSISNNQVKYEVMHDNSVDDFVIGREGTPLESRLVSVSRDKSCRVSDLETGAEINKINFDGGCRSIAVDEAQSLIAVGNGKKVTFIETTNFTKVKEVPLNNSVYSLAFNKRNDCMLAVTKAGEVYSLEF